MDWTKTPLKRSPCRSLGPQWSYEGVVDLVMIILFGDGGRGSGGVIIIRRRNCSDEVPMLSFVNLTWTD